MKWQPACSILNNMNKALSPIVMPALFVGHGLAINAALNNDFTESLRSLRTRLPSPDAIAVISAHWSTPEVRVTSSPFPKQIFDSIEFQEELYAISYAPPGKPDLADTICSLLLTAGINAKSDSTRGIDYGAWGILVHLFPEAQIPVVEISLSYHIDTKKIVDVGKALAQLRNERILLIGSGALVQNLYEISKNIKAKPYPWALEADRKIAAIIQAGDASALSEFALRNLGRSPAMPTPEHILPAIAILAMKEKDDRISFFHESFQNASISMRSFIIEHG